MTEVENIVVDHVRHIRGAVDGLRDDMREVKGRLGIGKPICEISNRMDWLDSRIERIERRPELTEA